MGLVKVSCSHANSNVAFNLSGMSNRVENEDTEGIQVKPVQEAPQNQKNKLHEGKNKLIINRLKTFFKLH